jgi:hypothetical protein
VELKEMWIGAEKLFPKDYNSELTEHSNKMIILFNLLKELKKVNERIVIVSNFTSILDEIQIMLTENDVSYSRLDGSISTAKRQDLIDSFNNPNSPSFVFLLSARAGAYGINLIGANRLILFDPDWNPSVDLQAMSRVYREGQKKNVFVYRFISTGTIEEKIFQRQIVKTSLSDSVVDEKKSKAIFSKEMLRELFVYKEDLKCETYKISEDDIFMEMVKENDKILYKAIVENSIENLITYVKYDDKLEKILEEKKDSMEEDEGEEKKDENVLMEDEEEDEDIKPIIDEDEDEETKPIIGGEDDENEYQFEDEPEQKKRKL